MHLIALDGHTPNRSILLERILPASPVFPISNRLRQEVASPAASTDAGRRRRNCVWCFSTVLLPRDPATLSTCFHMPDKMPLIFASALTWAISWRLSQDKRVLQKGSLSPSIPRVGQIGWTQCQCTAGVSSLGCARHHSAHGSSGQDTK